MFTSDALARLQVERQAGLAIAVEAQAENYSALHARYATALEITVGTIASEAMLAQQAPVDEPAPLEIVTWRIDGISTRVDDEKINFAARARLLVSEASGTESAPEGALLERPLHLRDRVPRELRGKIGKAGLYLHGIEYRDAGLQLIGGFMPTAKSKDAQITHLRPDPLEDQVYAADPKAGEVVAFPTMPTYAELIEKGYGKFCAEKAAGLASTRMLGDALVGAAATDWEHSKTDTEEVADNLGRFRERAAELHAPDDVRERIKNLAMGLYNQTPGGPLCPELAAALTDPHVAVVAELAQLDKWTYKERVGIGYTMTLDARLAAVQQWGPIFQHELHQTIMGDEIGLQQAIAGELSAAEEAAVKAEKFSAHLGPLVTLPLTNPPDQEPIWRVRAR